MNQLKLGDSIASIHQLEKGKKLSRPLIGSFIQAGFPSPATDYIEKSLDLNEFLIEHPAATYFIRVDGYSMLNAGINPDDILIVDRAIEASNNKIVIAVYDGELTVKKLKIREGVYYLVPENSQYNEIQITGEVDFSIWGVVTFIIHKA